MARFDLTDHEWSIIQPRLPNKTPGIARVDDRGGIDGILWRWRNGLETTLLYLTSSSHAR